MESAERTACLRLIRSENVGPVTFKQLLTRYGTAREALKALPALAAQGGRKRPLRVASRGSVEQEQSDIETLGGYFLLYKDPDYPKLLSSLYDAPPVLCCLGHTSLLHRRSVGIVGTRRASIAGKKIAYRFAEQLGQRGLCVVSGMARGVDTQAHEGSLDTGTVAVLAGGVNVVYPRENEGLYHKICDQGLVLSEMPCGEAPQSRYFLRRNRIIAGLSLGVVVVEAALRSGSLSTARLALEYGREVFAVPGSPLDPRAAGTNDLLKKGASFAEHPGDVTDVLNRLPIGHMFEAPAMPSFSPEPSVPHKARQRIAEAIGYVPINVDDVVRETGEAASVVQTVLLEYELAGKLERLPGGMVVMIEEIV